MTRKEIKIILLQKDLTVTSLAEELGVRRQELSMCIHGAREYPEIRKKLADRLGFSVEQMWPESSAKRAVSAA